MTRQDKGKTRQRTKTRHKTQDQTRPDQDRRARKQFYISCNPVSAHHHHLCSFAIIGDYGCFCAGCDTSIVDGECSGGINHCEQNVVKLLTALESQFGKAQFIITSGDNAYWNGNVDQLELGTFGLSMRTSLCYNTFDKIRQYSCLCVCFEGAIRSSGLTHGTFLTFLLRRRTLLCTLDGRSWRWRRHTSLLSDPWESW